jgi:hypothetical protein
LVQVLSTISACTARKSHSDENAIPIYVHGSLLMDDVDDVQLKEEIDLIMNQIDRTLKKIESVIPQKEDKEADCADEQKNKTVEA